MSDKLTWFEVDEGSLSKAQAEMLAAYRAKSKAATEARDAFNNSFIASVTKAGKVPAGKVAKVGHNFGKLAIAFADPDSKGTSGSGKAKFRV
jgi:hypothetical protein